MMPLGLSVATASIVGNALGMNKRDYAIQMSHYAILTILCIELGIGVALRLLGKVFCSTFTTDAGVLETTYELIIFLSIFCCVDGVQGVASGILRGAGQQSVGAVTNVIAFYGIGLPCAWLLCFNAKMRVPGLMVGISFGTFFQVASLSFLIYRRPDYIFQSQLKDESEGKEGDTNESSNASQPYRKVNGAAESDLEMLAMRTDCESVATDDMEEVSFSHDDDNESGKSSP
jgi:MATE family multidrug resistance protein